MAIKLLIGGSPCTYWSIAQSSDKREVVAEGIGWELFENYLIAKEKFKPDFFLYENNKSASQAIKDQIATELGVGVDLDVRFTYINSALVSAQNRQRFYVTNFGDIEQPEDRGILLKDILETGLPRYDKSPCIDANYYKGGNLTRFECQSGQRLMAYEPVFFQHPRGKNKGGCKSGKSPTLTARGAWEHNNKVIEPVRVGDMPNAKGEINGEPAKARSGTDGKTYTVYKVENGLISIKGKQYEIDLADGYYIIRKLTVKECARLQTMPDDYCKAVSDSQAYKALGNGWTAEVIIHLLNHALKDVSRDTEIIVLSLYDGIATGRYCLDKMGFTNVKYHAYEIDPYAIKIAMSNYPDIVQCGDAFQIRNF